MLQISMELCQENLNKNGYNFKLYLTHPILPISVKLRLSSITYNLLVVTSQRLNKFKVKIRTRLFSKIRFYFSNKASTYLKSRTPTTSKTPVTLEPATASGPTHPTPQAGPTSYRRCIYLLRPH